MIDLREAFKLTGVQDSEVVFFRPRGASRFESIIVTSKQVRERYDMRKIKVSFIQPRFEAYGSDYQGIEFTIIETKHKEK